MFCPLHIPDREEKAPALASGGSKEWAGAWTLQRICGREGGEPLPAESNECIAKTSPLLSKTNVPRGGSPSVVGTSLANVRAAEDKG